MVKEDLVNKDFNTANSKLASINHSDLNTWNWNNDAAFVEKSKAQAVKLILDSCSGVDSLLKQENESFARIEIRHTIRGEAPDDEDGEKVFMLYPEGDDKQ